jgi:hypothetical protein
MKRIIVLNGKQLKNHEAVHDRIVSFGAPYIRALKIKLAL